MKIKTTTPLLLISAVFFFFQNCAQKKAAEIKAENLSDYKIAYNVLHDEEKDDYEVFVMNTDGTEKTNVSNHPGVDWVYYAYGDKIYFISDRDTCHRCYFLYETNAKGENIRQVSDIRLNDSWMGSRNDGKELIVRPWSKQDSAFYIINLKGDVLSKIDPGLPYINDPFFSPDGQRVVFRGSPEKFNKERKKHDELYLINADGTGLEQLTHYPETDTTAKWHSYHAGPPFWSGKNDFISFISFQKGTYSIFKIKPDGSGLEQITSDSLDQGWHAWTPAGNWLAMNAKDETGNYDIYLADKNGEGKIRLTDSGKYEQAPVFVRK